MVGVIRKRAGFWRKYKSSSLCLTAWVRPRIRPGTSFWRRWWRCPRRHLGSRLEHFSWRDFDVLSLSHVRRVANPIHVQWLDRLRGNLGIFIAIPPEPKAWLRGYQRSSDLKVYAIGIRRIWIYCSEPIRQWINIFTPWWWSYFHWTIIIFPKQQLSIHQSIW